MFPSKAIFPPGSRVLCLGAGGIGVSAIAQWLQHLGVHVSCADQVDSEILQMLREKGIKIVAERDKKLENSFDILVYSDAVLENHPLRLAARRRGVSQYSYAEALGLLTEPYHLIAISGTHGKSTTTALTGLILKRGGYDPTVVVGTRVPAFGNSNFWAGSGKIAVVEADEYRNHFLTLSPAVAVITNVDYDHVDFFPTRESYFSAFQKLVGRTDPTGLLVLRESDENTGRLIDIAGDRQVALFDFDKTPRKDKYQHSKLVRFSATQFAVKRCHLDFKVKRNGANEERYSLPFSGDHLVLNALASIAAVSKFGISAKTIQETFANFSGTWRRFEHLGKLNSAPIISDYAHHPRELQALLKAARECYPGRRVLIAFQPHQRARTKAFAKEFIRALCAADVVIVGEVYDVAGRESAGDITSTKRWPEVLRQKGVTAVYACTLDDIEREVREKLQAHDVALIVGAGTIDIVARRLVGLGSSK